METKEAVTLEETKEITELLKQLPEEDVKVAKGYLSALVDMQEIRDQKAAG